MTRHSGRGLARRAALALGIAAACQGQAETWPARNDTTVVYDAAYFSEYQPVSVDDMVSRIPGVGLALGRGGRDRRGLGAGENEILINGQRQTGKSNEGRSQLSRIAADQVDYIEIIRGTSGEMDIRGSGQVVNIVLLDSRSRSSVTAELNADYKQDDTYHPGAKMSWAGQAGAFNYLFSAEAEPRYENRRGAESSRDAAGRLLETRREESVRDQTEYEASFNLGWRLENGAAQFNGLYGEDAPPEDKRRAIADFSGGTAATRWERERIDRGRSNWELGGDYEHSFDGGGTYRLLFIVNDREFQSVRERFEAENRDGTEEKNLHLRSAGRDRERIARTSYSWDVAGDHGLELGVERAQTIRDGDIRLGLAGDGAPSPLTGGLVPSDIDNALSTVEEIRYENFVVHNWRLDDRMSLESSLVYELSTISQTGDVVNERDFRFLRPKLDYRFDITPSLQLRATALRDVSQLSFSDFSSSSDGGDDDRDIQAGNPDIAQERSWNYGLNLEYRLPGNAGVLNAELYYHDISDVIDRIDVTSDPLDPASARGNIGDAVRYGIDANISARLGFVGLPSALLTVGFGAQDSEVTDPFTRVQRRLRRSERWNGRLNFRHDVTRWNLSYGFGYWNSDDQGGGRAQIDIADIERERRGYGLGLFAEKKAFDGVTFRFDARDVHDPERCRERVRFAGLTAEGVVDEVENLCWRNGPNYSLKVRYTF